MDSSKMSSSIDNKTDLLIDTQIDSIINSSFFTGKKKKAMIVSGSPEHIDVKVLVRLSKNFDIIMAVDAGANACIDAGIKVDYVVGDMDSIKNENLQFLIELGAQSIRVDAVKDFTDFELALDTLDSWGFELAIVFNALGGRLDHELATIGAILERRKLETILVGNIYSVFKVTDSLKLSDIGCRIGQEYSLIAANDDTVVSETGVKYELDEFTLRALSGRGVSNIITDESAKVCVHFGSVLLILNH